MVFTLKIANFDTIIWFNTNKMKRFKTYFILSLLISVFILTSCNKDDGDEHNLSTLTDPIASFSWIGNDKPAPVTVQFSNTSQNSDQYEWKFGDNSMPSTVKNPSHTYNNTSNKPKNITVTLTATDSKTERSNTRSRVITIQPQN